MTEQSAATAKEPERDDASRAADGLDSERPSLVARSPSLRVGTPTVGLQRRLTWVFLSLVFTVLGLSSLSFFLHARRTYLRQQQQELRLLAQIIADEIDGDLHARLARRDEPGYQEIRARLDFGAYAATMVNQLRSALASDSELEISVDKVELTTERAVPCGLILNELVTNALKHGRSPDGRCRLRIEVRALPAGFALPVGDRGPGLPAVDVSASRRSLGRDITRGLVRQLRATLTQTSDGGATCTLTVPEEA